MHEKRLSAALYMQEKRLFGGSVYARKTPFRRLYICKINTFPAALYMEEKRLFGGSVYA